MTRPAAEAIGHLGELGWQGGAIRGVAGKGLDRDWLAQTITEQANHNLLLAPFVLAVIAKGSELVVHL